LTLYKKYAIMKLSIVIPAYKTENTLERCLKSVINQNISDYEMILVDDGSPDKCGEICDEWANRNNKIKVIHKANGGLSDARNTGIDAAQGDYITFVDSDDAIEENSLYELMTELQNHPEYDFIEYPTFRFYKFKNQNILNFENHVYTDLFNDYWLKDKAYCHTYAWNKIYKRQLFDRVRYPLGLYFEDVYTLPEIIKECKTIATSSHGMYYYYANPNGITQTSSGETLSQLLKAHVNIFMKLQTEKHYKWSDLMAYYMHIVNIQCDVYELTNHDITLPNIRPGFSLILNSNTTLKVKIKTIIINILGLKKLCILNKILHNKRIQH
jgi:glycosyltransferase involved in cell wall biosynthesis